MQGDGKFFMRDLLRGADCVLFSFVKYVSFNAGAEFFIPFRRNVVD